MGADRTLPEARQVPPVRAGPKAAVTAGPLDLSHLPAGGPERVVAFVEEFCTIPRGHGAGERFRLRPFQLEIIAGLFAEPRPRTGLVSMPRGNGKSALAAALGLYALLADGVAGAQVIVVASDQRQAGIVWNIARRMVELDGRLAEQCQLYQRRIFVPASDSEFTTLPAEPDALQGWDPSMVICDELHVVTADVWEAISLAAGKRPESLTLAVSTPSDNRESVMWRLRERGMAGRDESLFFREWAAPAGCAVDDEEAWHEANPALGDFLALDALRATAGTTREGPFRRFRLGQWVGRTDGWLPWGTWPPLAAERTLQPGERVVLGFDGSASGDSTALVACTMDSDPFVAVVGVWENPGDPRWRVPRGEVLDRIAEAFDRYDVVELAADPWGWRTELESLAEVYPERVVQLPTNVPSRIGPAADRAYALIADGRLSHDGDRDLARHVANTVVRRSPAGDLPVKDGKSSPRKIDLCIAMLLAVERAAWHRNRPARKGQLVVF